MTGIDDEIHKYLFYLSDVACDGWDFPIVSNHRCLVFEFVPGDHDGIFEGFIDVGLRETIARNMGEPT